MASGDRINGADVLVSVNISASAPNWQIVAHQRGVEFALTNALIDISSKSSGRRSEYLPGREDEDVTLDALWVESATAYGYIKSAARDGSTVEIKRLYNSVDVESCDAVITNLSESFPDQEAGTVSLTFKRTGPWVDLFAGPNP